VLRKLSSNKFFRGLRFKYKKSEFIFRYLYQYDQNKLFLKNLGEFIANDLSHNVYDDMSTSSNTFFIDLVDNNFMFIDKRTFHNQEQDYIRRVKSQRGNMYSKDMQNY